MTKKICLILTFLVAFLTLTSVNAEITVPNEKNFETLQNSETTESISIENPYNYTVSINTTLSGDINSQNFQIPSDITIDANSTKNIDVTIKTSESDISGKIFWEINNTAYVTNIAIDTKKTNKTYSVEKTIPEKLTSNKTCAFILNKNIDGTALLYLEEKDRIKQLNIKKGVAVYHFKENEWGNISFSYYVGEDRNIYQAKVYPKSMPYFKTPDDISLNSQKTIKLLVDQNPVSRQNVIVKTPSHRTMYVTDNKGQIKLWFNETGKYSFIVKYGGPEVKKVIQVEDDSPQQQTKRKQPYIKIYEGGVEVNSVKQNQQYILKVETFKGEKIEQIQSIQVNSPKGINTIPLSDGQAYWTPSQSGWHTFVTDTTEKYLSSNRAYDVQSTTQKKNESPNYALFALPLIIVGIVVLLYFVLENKDIQISDYINTDLFSRDTEIDKDLL